MEWRMDAGQDGMRLVGLWDRAGNGKGEVGIGMWLRGGGRGWVVESSFNWKKPSTIQESYRSFIITNPG